MKKLDDICYLAAAYFAIPNDTNVGIWDRIYHEEGPEALFTKNRGRKALIGNKKIKDKEPNIDK